MVSFIYSMLVVPLPLLTFEYAGDRRTTKEPCYCDMYSEVNIYISPWLASFKSQVVEQPSLVLIIKQCIFKRFDCVHNINQHCRQLHMNLRSKMSVITTLTAHNISLPRSLAEAVRALIEEEEERRRGSTIRAQLHEEGLALEGVALPYARAALS